MIEFYKMFDFVCKFLIEEVEGFSWGLLICCFFFIGMSC